jgi:hypothetical protein
LDVSVNGIGPVVCLFGWKSRVVRLSDAYTNSGVTILVEIAIDSLKAL